MRNFAVGVFWVLASIANLGNHAWAQNESPLEASTPQVEEAQSEPLPTESPQKPAPWKIFDLSLRQEPARARNFVFSPLLSFVIPGLDQALEGQTAPFLFYSGTSLFGWGLIQFSLRDVDYFAPSPSKSENNTQRLYALGAQTYQTAGSLSAYASFRSAVRSQQAHGEYTFLSQEEDAGDLLSAPFAFSELKRPTTYIPLLVIAALGAATANRWRFGNLSLSDAAFSAAFSYHAGVGEEALFRGWLMPVTHHYLNHRFWSNTITSTLFAAAHLKSIKFPLPQFLLGWHLGNQVQRNNWTLRQAIFIHTWYDVLAFSLSYMNPQTRKAAILQIPLVNMIW
jgi:membrane protease YdiL (CAAX protease family)